VEQTAADPAERLRDAVIRGLRHDAAAAVTALLKTTAPMEIIDRVLIPALDTVGARYEQKTLFLPQLLQAAAAAQAAFGEIRAAIAGSGTTGENKGDILLATVQGDVHDIGKNIVKVILENYGFRVRDLGRDVPVETVVREAKAGNYRLVGLSALMTTTVKSMERTIAALHAQVPGCKIWVGGAVLTPEYAASIGADWYCSDAKQSADLARRFFFEN
jgi:5-methyltetrahydrofolate--homocysteine methyltransferase